MIVERYPNLKKRLAVQSPAMKLSLHLTAKLARWLTPPMCQEKEEVYESFITCYPKLPALSQKIQTT